MDKSSEEQTLTPVTKPRIVFVALLFSVVAPGLGQVYNGQAKKAILFWGILLFFQILFGLTDAATSFYGLAILVLIQVASVIYMIIDAVKNAKRQKRYTLKPYNTWFYYLLIAILPFVVFNVFDTRSFLGIQTYRLPSQSNNPTLQVGDCVVADRHAYKNKEIGYGDIVVFNTLKDGAWIFRVVGLPHDTLELTDNIVTINGKQSKALFIKDTVVDGIAVSAFIEELPNGHQHHIYTFQPYDSTKATIRDIVVPAGRYYLLGDNRDNAADSRYIGSIKREDILGKIIYSYWGKTRERINIDFHEK